MGFRRIRTAMLVVAIGAAFSEMGCMALVPVDAIDLAPPPMGYARYAFIRAAINPLRSHLAQGS